MNCISQHPYNCIMTCTWLTFNLDHHLTCCQGCNFFFLCANLQGLGRRRFKNGNNKYQPDLLAWMPEKKEWQKSVSQHSVYRLNFQESPSKPIKEQIVKRPKTSFDDSSPVTTSYRYAHGTANPHRDLLTAMSNHGLTTHQNRRVNTQGSGRESVANCMSWYHPPAKTAQVSQNRPNRPLVPAATAPVTIVPHPPSVAKPSSAKNSAVCQPTAAPSLPVRTQPEQTNVQVAMTE